MKKIKITKEQYDKIFATGLINESEYNRGKFMTEGSNNLKKETIDLIKYLYRKSENFSSFWGEHDLAYDDICDALLSKGLIVGDNGKYELSKTSGSPEKAIQAVEEELRKLIGSKPELETEASNYAPGTDRYFDKFYRTKTYTEPKKPKTILYEVIVYNYEMAILKNVQDGSLYVFYYDQIDRKEFFKYAEVEKNSKNEYDDFEIDANVIGRYVNDNLSSISQGEGIDAFEKGIDLIKIDEPLKNKLIELYSNNKNIVKALSSGEIKEMTGAASSGAFTGALGMPTIKKEMPVDTNNLDVPVVKETTTATAGNYQYHANALPDIDRDGTFKVHKKTKAEKNTQWAGGSFVEFNDCTKLNNKPAGAGCSQGAVDNVVKLKKTKSNVNAPSLSESKINETNKGHKA